MCNVCSYLCWRCSALSLLLFWNRARTDEKNIKSYRKSNCRQKQTRRSSICCCFITYFCCYDVTAHALELMPRWLFLMLLLLLALLLHFDFSENAHNKFMWRRLSPGSGTVGSHWRWQWRRRRWWWWLQSRGCVFFILFVSRVGGCCWWSTNEGTWEKSFSNKMWNTKIQTAT